MNKTVYKFLLIGDKFVSELHLKQPRFTYSICAPFTKHREMVQKFRETGDLRHIYKNELAKAYCARDAIYSESKDLAKRTISDKLVELKVRAYEYNLNPRHGGRQRETASVV